MAYFQPQVGGIVASLITIVFGVLVLSFPKFLRYVVGIYLLIIGVVGLLTSI
jgi:hypothetical protein